MTFGQSYEINATQNHCVQLLHATAIGLQGPENWACNIAQHNPQQLGVQ
jgi:hypothetical protein